MRTGLGHCARLVPGPEYGREQWGTRWHLNPAGQAYLCVLEGRDLHKKHGVPRGLYWGEQYPFKIQAHLEPQNVTLFADVMS